VGILGAVLLTAAGADSHGPPGGAGAPWAGWRPGRAVPVAVEGGRAGFEIPTPTPGTRALVIVSALSRAPGPYPIRLAARPATRVDPPRLADDGPRLGPRPEGPPPAPSPPPPGVLLPPGERTFHLMVRAGDVASASNYRPVRACLRALGRRVQVYVDARDLGLVGDGLLRDVVATLDDRVLPTAAPHFGLARDVDGDGRFTVLITGWLSRLAGGRLAVDGFVRGADLDPDVPAPFGNRCDMMYLSAALRPGPHLRTVLAHEYTHAATFSQKARAAAAAGGPPGFEEEGWLDEALAHLAEDLHGFSRTNLDYRVSAFLSAPGRYRLVVEDYYAADLFRSHGHRGGTYLFLRWCVDGAGPGLLGALARSGRRGIDNLEAATGRPFAALFRDWTVALALDGLDPRDAPGPFTTLDLRSEIGGWPLAGPRTARVVPGPGERRWTAAGTSSHFVLVEAADAGGVRIEVAGPPEADLQVTAIPLPEDLPQMILGARAEPGPDGLLHLVLRIRGVDGAPIRLGALSWEPLVPAADPRAAGFRRAGLDAAGIAALFGSTTLPPRGELASRPIPLAGVGRGDGPLVVKALGTDPRGRRIAAWADLDLPPAGDLARDDAGRP
jgi:hypothetical protein